MPRRLLRLLSLLQGRREWSGRELARRLGVTERTVRRDIERLRALGYTVDSTTGIAGGYRLASGRGLPPLLFDDDEAIAVAVALVTAAGGAVAGIEDSSMGALVKLQQVLPARLRPRLAALTSVSAAIPHRTAPPVDSDTLAVLAACARDQEIVSFDYRNRAGAASTRRVEPRNLITIHGLWYLLAYDLDRVDWRTFRVDRIDQPRPSRQLFTARELPAPDAATYLTRSFATATYRHTARITVRLPAEVVRARVFGPIPGEISPDSPDSCTIRLSGDSPELMTQYITAIAAIGAEITLDASDEITQRIRDLARRLALPPS